MTPAESSSHLVIRVSKVVLRIAVAGVLTAYLLWKSHPRDVLAAMTGAAWGPLAVAVALVLADRTLMAYRWVVLLCIVAPEKRPRLAAVMRVFFVSTFLGTFLPASVGSDAVRAYSLARLNVSGSDSVASVFMDRMLGVASVLVMALVGLSFTGGLRSNIAVLASLAAAAMACAATMLLIFSSGAAALAARLVNRLPILGTQHAVRKVLESIRRYAAYHGELLRVLVGSIAVQVLRIIQAYYLGQALGIDAAFSVYIAFIPLILLVMLLPITVNGIGTSQAAFLSLFGPRGVPAAAAFALSVLFVGLGVVGNLPGGLLYVFGRRERGPAFSRIS